MPSFAIILSYLKFEYLEEKLCQVPVLATALFHVVWGTSFVFSAADGLDCNFCLVLITP